MKKYRESDYALLVQTVDRYGQPFTMPNILTETINHLGVDSEYARVAPVVVSGWPESYVSSSDAFRQPEYGYLGLTDTAILLALGKADWLITADVKLHIAASNRKLNSVNFDHRRFE